jgi:hypothetical protein
MGYTQPFFNVRKIAGGYSIYPVGETTDDLTIFANPINIYPFIRLEGNAGIAMTVAGANVLRIDSTTLGSYIVAISYDGTDCIIKSASDKDLLLQTQGTGLVKFGTRTAGGDTVSNGYITIKDAAGNTVKLMTTA